MLGVEHLSEEERSRSPRSGVDQFGGEACPEIVVGLVQSGQVLEARLDESVRRLLAGQVPPGLFDAPYLNPEAAEQIVGNAAFRKAGELAQRKSIVPSQEYADARGNGLAAARQAKILVIGIDPEIAAAMGRSWRASRTPSWR